jgi:uncharacterized membrane protein YkvA (DUF1232 family)
MTQQQGSPARDPGWLSAQWKKLRLSWRLLRDPLVPLWTKLIPLGVVAYVLLPIDLIPDPILGLGQLDDLGIFLLGLKWFIDLCPSGSVGRHVAEMSSVKAQYHVVPDGERAPPADVSGFLESASHEVLRETAPSPTDRHQESSE